jgi:nitrogen fixation NifU-like protein
MSNPNLDELYQTIILEHSRNPRHYGRIEGNESKCVEGYNPLCGDQVGACAIVRNEKFETLHCFGQGCAISKASASLMAEILQGQSVARFYELFELLQAALKGDAAAISKLEGLGDLSALAGVRRFPARVKCATLGWQALKEALEK